MYCHLSCHGFKRKMYHFDLVRLEVIKRDRQTKQTFKHQFICLYFIILRVHRPIRSWYLNEFDLQSCLEYSLPVCAIKTKNPESSCLRMRAARPCLFQHRSHVIQSPVAAAPRAASLHRNSRDVRELRVQRWERRVVRWARVRPRPGQRGHLLHRLQEVRRVDISLLHRRIYLRLQKSQTGRRACADESAGITKEMINTILIFLFNNWWVVCVCSVWFYLAGSVCFGHSNKHTHTGGAWSDPDPIWNERIWSERSYGCVW